MFETAGGRIVLKDFRPRGFLVRNTIGRFSMSRETRAYGRLASLPGIPRFHGRIDPYALACEFIEGRPLPEHPRASLPGSFFRALESLLAKVHERGVAVADLHHRNVIVAARSGDPVLVDFSLALAKPSAWNLPGRWLFERALQLDRIAFERIRLRYEAPSGGVPAAGGADAGSANPRDASSRASALRLHSWGRSLKRLRQRLRGKR